MNVGWPEGIYLAMSIMGVGYAIAKHGQPREPWSMGTAIFASALAFGLLWWGGFFA